MSWKVDDGISASVARWAAHSIHFLHNLRSSDIASTLLCLGVKGHDAGKRLCAPNVPETRVNRLTVGRERVTKYFTSIRAMLQALIA